MSVITISPEAALRKEFIEQSILTKLSPKLPFLDLFPVVDLQGASTFQYSQDTTTAADDITAGVMSAPVDMSELGQMTKVKVSPISRKVGDTYSFGYKLEFSKQVTRENGFVDEILRAYDRVTYGMTKKINDDIYTNMSTFASAPAGTLGDGVWSASGNSIPTSSSISDDIIGMEDAFDQEGWDYEMTDLYLNKRQYYAVKRYYRATEVGQFDPNDVEGLKLNNTKSGVTSGTAFGIDMNVKPITIYKNTDPDFSSAPESSIININKFRQQEYPHKDVIEIWAEMGLAMKQPYAVQKTTGLV